MFTVSHDFLCDFTKLVSENWWLKPNPVNLMYHWPNNSIWRHCEHKHSLTHCTMCGKLFKMYTLQRHKWNHTKSWFSNTLVYRFPTLENKIQLGLGSGWPKKSSCMVNQRFWNNHRMVNQRFWNNHLLAGTPWLPPNNPLPCSYHFLNHKRTKNPSNNNIQKRGVRTVHYNSASEMGGLGAETLSTETFAVLVPVTVPPRL